MVVGFLEPSASSSTLPVVVIVVVDVAAAVATVVAAVVVASAAAAVVASAVAEAVVTPAVVASPAVVTAAVVVAASGSCWLALVGKQGQGCPTFPTNKNKSKRQPGNAQQCSAMTSSRSVLLPLPRLLIAKAGNRSYWMSLDELRTLLLHELECQ